jgi:hypothetical protein
MRFRDPPIIGPGEEPWRQTGSERAEITLDNPTGGRDTPVMLRSGAFRQRLARTLNVAYGDGLLSESTLAYRLDQLLGSRLVDPDRLVGDLSLRSPERSLSTAVARAVQSAQRFVRGRDPGEGAAPILLALDWEGGEQDLVVGRHPESDIVLTHLTVSRRHARLSFRDGGWILRDLDSSNGTTVNNTRVTRCRLLPGDQLMMGDELLVVD